MRLLPIIRTLHPISSSEYKVIDTAGPRRSSTRVPNWSSRSCALKRTPSPSHSRPIEEPRIIGPSIRSHIPPPYPPPSCQKRLRYLNSSQLQIHHRRRLHREENPPPTAIATATERRSATDHRTPSLAIFRYSQKTPCARINGGFLSICSPDPCRLPTSTSISILRLRESSSALSGQTSPNLSYLHTLLTLGRISEPEFLKRTSQITRAPPITVALIHLLSFAISFLTYCRIALAVDCLRDAAWHSPTHPKFLRAVELRAFQNAL